MVGTWTCDTCGNTIELSYEDLANSGNPICAGTAECEGEEMTLAYVK